ncbi:hypothetical protein BGX26_009263, partial [Mortierella sp. AD094]
MAGIGKRKRLLKQAAAVSATRRGVAVQESSEPQYEQGLESESESDDDWDEDIEYENKKIHSSLLQRMQEAESTQKSHLRGSYSGSSRTTQWRKKQRTEALVESALGTKSITSYFSQEPPMDLGDTDSDGDTDQDEEESRPFTIIIDEITAYLTNKDIV